MKLFEKIIIVPGKKYEKSGVYIRPITLQRILDCFSWKHRRDYIGINWNLFQKGHEGYYLMEEFFDFVAKKAKRWYIPYWYLNLLYLYGMDHSIVRCRNAKIAKRYRKFTGGIMITDVKEKWGTLRIYGSFTQEIQDKLGVLEIKINQFLEPY